MSESRIHLEGLKAGDVALLKDVAEAAATSAVEKTFIAMGLDPKDPIAAQKDFSYLRDMTSRARDQALADDMNWLRRTRLRCEGISGKVIMGVVGVATVGGLGALWEGFKAAIGRAG